MLPSRRPPAPRFNASLVEASRLPAPAWRDALGVPDVPPVVVTGHTRPRFIPRMSHQNQFPGKWRVRLA